MAQKQAFIVCFIGKCSVQGQHKNFKTLGIPQIGSNRQTNWTESCIDIQSIDWTWWNLPFSAFLALKAISKMVVLDNFDCFTQVRHGDDAAFAFGKKK